MYFYQIHLFNVWLSFGKTSQVMDFVYSVTRKIAQYLGETLEDRSDKLQGNLQVNGGMFTSYHHQLKKGI